jgi:hypothetical protein
MPITGWNPDSGEIRSAPKRRLTRRAIQEIIARRADEMIAECGHISYPGHVAVLVDNKKKHVWCPECKEYKWASRNATPREVLNGALGLPLDFEPEPLPDIPPF